MTLYDLLSYVDNRVLLSAKIKRIIIHIYAPERFTNDIDLVKEFEYNGWEDTVINSPLIDKNEVYYSVIYNNLSAIQSNFTPVLEVTLKDPKYLEDPVTECVDKTENMYTDNQQLSENNSTEGFHPALGPLESCGNALKVKDINPFLSSIQEDMKVFGTDGERIFPITMISVLKSGSKDDNIAVVFGQLKRSLIFESSTTRDNPVDVK